MVCFKKHIVHILSGVNVQQFLFRQRWSLEKHFENNFDPSCHAENGAKMDFRIMLFVNVRPVVIFKFVRNL